MPPFSEKDAPQSNSPFFALTWLTLGHLLYSSDMLAFTRLDFCLARIFVPVLAQVCPSIA
ncbi:MAG: hypothetical protein VKK80_12345 [Prochlorothrix sp.]|nr:hypothetical protein [Prochlorothrix sp.]